MSPVQKPKSKSAQAVGSDILRPQLPAVRGRAQSRFKADADADKHARGATSTRSGSATPSGPKFWRSCATWGLTLRPNRAQTETPTFARRITGRGKVRCQMRAPSREVNIERKTHARGYGGSLSHPSRVRSVSPPVHKFFARIATPPFFIRPTTSDIIR
jgi:hypothetical protein